MTHKTLEPVTLGPLKLANRIVVAPVTRSGTFGDIPNAKIAEYYRQQATEGLIVTEGLSPMAEGPSDRTPGLFNHDQVAWWGYVTAAVHWRGGNIFAQLLHTRGASDPGRVRDAFVRSAVLAIRAGFDGVEVHVANSNSLERFLGSASIDDGTRFTLEVVDDVANAIGADRTGVRLSPSSVTGVIPIAAKLQQIDVAYLHLFAPNPPHRSVSSETVREIRRVFTNTLIINSGVQTIDDIDAAIASSDADLVSVGQPLTTNPGFVERPERSLPLSVPDEATWLAPEPGGPGGGFIDYPSAA